MSWKRFWKTVKGFCDVSTWSPLDWAVMLLTALVGGLWVWSAVKHWLGV